MVVGFTTIYAIGAYHHSNCEFESRSGEVCTIQHHVIKLVSDSRQLVGFLRVLRFPPTNETDRHDINEILLKGALTNITLAHNIFVLALAILL
jgi:hypothetical protein